MPKYSRSAGKDVEEHAMHKMKRGELKSGGSSKKLKAEGKQLQLAFPKHVKRERKCQRESDTIDVWKGM